MSDQFRELREKEMEQVVGGDAVSLVMQGEHGTAGTMPTFRNQQGSADTLENDFTVFNGMSMKDIHEIAPNNVLYKAAQAYLRQLSLLNKQIPDDVHKL